MLCQGRVKLSVFSSDGRSMILTVAQPGEVLGLNSIISNNAYHETGEAVDDCQVNFVSKDDFLLFLKQNQEAALNAVRQLSRSYDTACSQIRSLVLSNSTAEKLARLLLKWLPENGTQKDPIKVPFTHEEIAAMIGTSRETVTRTLSYFKARGFIAVKGREITIRNSRQLESMLGERTQRG
jgi:CRP/FNR family transcriptional regulator